MASTKRKKEALKAAVYSYFAGAHFITELVEKAQSLTKDGSTKDAVEMRHAMLEADYERLRESPHLIEGFIEQLDEQDLYPFGSEWPREALEMLAEKLVPPKLSIEEHDAELKFRFKKGFKDLVTDMAASIDAPEMRPSSLDHWMVVLLNSAFHAGAIAAARSAENPKLYYDVMNELEEEQEPWTKYPQLSDLLDKQLRRETRRKTGLVSDFDY